MSTQTRNHTQAHRQTDKLTEHAHHEHSEYTKCNNILSNSRRMREYEKEDVCLHDGWQSIDKCAGVLFILRQVYRQRLMTGHLIGREVIRPNWRR